MIISASRRTDIPAFRAAWFMRRVRAGYCEVASPFDRKRIARISLAPDDIDAIVFWTRDPAPLLDSLDELDRFTRARLRRLEAEGLSPVEPSLEEIGPLIRSLGSAAESHGMTIFSCAEKLDLRPFSIRPGSCVDPDLIRRLFGIDVPSGKDPGQRPLCGCAPSRDIGAYDTCARGCLYCYAMRGAEPGRERRLGSIP
jgi:hypothetical protein